MTTPSSRGSSPCCSCSWTTLVLLPLLLLLLYIPLDRWMGTKSYEFTQADVASIANAARAGGGTPAEMMDRTVALFEKRYPHLVETGCLQDNEWIFMRAGGWMGAFRIIYASTTEYVLLFGTAMDTSGHSGRYLARIEDTLLSGRFVQWREGAVDAVVHGPGATVIHEKYEATGVEWEGGTWMVEHAQGLIPTTLPFAFADSLLSAQDLYSVWRAVAVYARLVTANLLQGRL
jgi:sigma non-opioid intracellular receptor